jgi:hypothetical protein
MARTADPSTNYSNLASTLTIQTDELDKDLDNEKIKGTKEMPEFQAKLGMAGLVKNPVRLYLTVDLDTRIHSLFLCKRSKRYCTSIRSSITSRSTRQHFPRRQCHNRTSNQQRIMGI